MSDSSAASMLHNIWLNNGVPVARFADAEHVREQLIACINYDTGTQWIRSVDS